ncbi:MAG: glutathione S-transferase family protein [Xanthomonadales bacterium]|nr:glutathione S-transferase family protein [Xanthomonadales bacterium]
MITIHGMCASGNCYKLQLLLSQLDQPYRWIEVDTLNGGTRTPEFLAKNPNGKVPLLELEDGRCLAESNAILCYLAEASPLLPNERWARAQTLQWLFFEQYSHEPYVAVARFIAKFLPADHPRRAELPRLQARAHQALAVMERELATRDFMVASGYSIADIALYAYTHDAPAGGIELGGYPHVQAWLRRVESQPRFVRQRD